MRDALERLAQQTTVTVSDPDEAVRMPPALPTGMDAQVLWDKAVGFCRPRHTARQSIALRMCPMGRGLGFA